VQMSRHDFPIMLSLSAKNAYVSVEDQVNIHFMVLKMRRVYINL